MSVVSALTVTAIGYRNGRVASLVAPTPAMMNENSPICAMLIPDFTESRRLRPVRKAPTETATIFPTITSTAKARMGPHQSRTTRGSIAIPTDTKKIATNRSRTGTISCSISFPNPDSATSDPAMNAPNATE